MSETLIPFGSLAQGWQYREDPSKIPVGAAFEMRNCQITDRGGIAPRPGTQLFGAADTSGTPCVSSGTHKTRNGTNVPLRSYSTFLEYYNTVTQTWEVLKSGFTSGQDFDFEDHNVNTDTTDYVYFCNAVDAYQRWRGYHSKITSALAGGEVSIPVSTTLKSEVFYSGTASASTDTTIDIASSSWAANMWNTVFVVRITSGAFSGRVSAISATTATQITFTAIAGLAGTVTTFEIRQLDVPTTGTLIYGGTTIAYTAVPTDSSFTVASANAAAINTAIAIVPEELLTNTTSASGQIIKRGNRLVVQNTRMFMANVIGNGPSMYYSKIANAGDFSFSATRVANDGGVIDTPEGGGNIKDAVLQEDVLYMLKNGIIKTLTFTQDGNDLPQIQTLVQSNEVSVSGKAFKVGNDTYFATTTNAITSIGRLPNIDTNPRAFDVSYDVKKGISLMDFTNFRGASYGERALGACKETEDSSSNDVVIAYNYKRGAWEGIWDLAVADWFDYNNELYFVSSDSKEAYKMFEGVDKEKSGTHYPVNAYWKSGYINMTKSGFHQQTLKRIAVTGWIATNTTLTFDLAYDFGTSAETYSWTFEGTETDYVFGEPVYNVLGTSPLGVEPIGSISADVSENKRKFLVYFNVPAKQHNWFQLGFGSNGTGQDWEIIDIAVDVEESSEINTNLVKDTES